MPNKYPHLPGINVELLDGNLQVDQAITGPVTLVIGRAASGPSNFQYLVSDSNQAAAIYGSGSPLMAKLSEVKLGGAKNVVLYRIGGQAAEVQGIFGADSLLATKEETVTAGGRYSVYIGPEPSDSAKACIIIFEGDTIVYSNVTGSTVDLGRFNIVGFDKDTSEFVSEYRVGSPLLPVALEDVATSIKLEGQLNQVGDGSTTNYDLSGGNNAVVRNVTVNGSVTTDYTISSGTGTGGVDEIVFNTAPPSAEAVVVDYGVDAVAAGAGAGEQDFTAGSRTGETITYVAGDDSMNATWKQFYEMLDEAYADLETTLATEVVVEKAILDAPNIADGSTDTDRLEYLYKEENFGEVTYEWNTETVLYKEGAGTTNILANADLDSNGQPIVAKRFEEVNFAHQMGTWCHNITENERFILGTIGTSVPAANTTAVVARWLGTLPQTDINGDIIADGSGLLGNRFMSGSTTQRDGFYLTDTGFPSGNAQVDANGAIVDLGKYLSVVAGVIQTPDIASYGSVSQVTNGSGLYTGLLSQTVPGQSTTNVVLPGVSPKCIRS